MAICSTIFIFVWSKKSISIWVITQILIQWKKISGIYTQNYIIYNFYCQVFILLIIFAFIKSQSLDDNIIILFSVIVKLFIVVFIFMVAKKNWYYQITERTFLSIERKFLFSENKTYFRFFRETQDVKVIFPRNTGCFFRETQDIIELL